MDGRSVRHMSCQKLYYCPTTLSLSQDDGCFLSLGAEHTCQQRSDYSACTRVPKGLPAGSLYMLHNICRGVEEKRCHHHLLVSPTCSSSSSSLFVFPFISIPSHPLGVFIFFSSFHFPPALSPRHRSCRRGSPFHDRPAS